MCTGFSIGQGCEDDAKSVAPLPVIAPRSVFPDATDSVASKINEDGTETPINLTDYSEGASGGAVTLAPNRVQDRSQFKIQSEIYDANGNTRGMDLKSGKLDVTATGVVPFRVTWCRDNRRTGNSGR